MRNNRPSVLGQAVQLINTKDVRKLIVVDGNNKMMGIITEIDIFGEMGRNPNMTASFIGENQRGEYREVYSKFTD